MLKLKLQYFGYLIWTTGSLDKSLMLGKIKGRRRGRQSICLDGITDAMDMNLGKRQKTMRDREAWCAAAHEVTKCRTWLESIQTSSVAQWCLTLCDPMDCSMPGLPVHCQLSEFTQLVPIESVMPSNHLILCCPFLLPPSIFPSIRVFSNESVLCIRWPKDWSFSVSISPSDEYSGLISFRMDWLDLLAVQGTLKSLLQHHSSKASVLWLPAFFIVHISHPYMTTGKTTALTRWTFVGRVMSLLFNVLFRLVITFLPRR